MALGEFGRIAQFFRPLAGPQGLSLADDAALISPAANKDLVVSQDMLVEGVHFLEGTQPERLAHKVLAVNISDLVAKGATPAYYTLGMALSRRQDDQWVERFARGLDDAQQRFGVLLIGGDSVKSGPGDGSSILISITAMGHLPSGTMVRRSGAQVGDTVFVSGTLGGSAAALHAILANRAVDDPACRDTYDLPDPPLILAPIVRQFASSSADISDGLLADAAHIASASGVQLMIDAERLPIHPVAHRLCESADIARETALSGGDDYQVVGTVSAKYWPAFYAAAQAVGCTVTAIGSVIKGEGIDLLGVSAMQKIKLLGSGYTHF